MLCAIIGGGAAGIFSALACKEANPDTRVIVLEKTNQLLSKVRISGGGRCNVTHACFDPAKLAQNYPRGSKELVGPFHTFQPKDTIAWFEKRGVLLKTEEDGRMFPTTDSSDTIIHCLLSEAARLGVEIRKQQKIASIQKNGSRFSLHLAHEILEADKMLLATGSAPWGHEEAARLGHKIIPPVPSLFTFNIPSSPLLDLAGISLSHAGIQIKNTRFKQEGPLLLTHWGFSGPAVLKLSAWAARELHALNYQVALLINWTGSQSQETLYQSLLQRKKEAPLQPIPSSLPQKLFQRLLSSLNVDTSTPIGRLSNHILTQIANKLCRDSYHIEGKTTHKNEFVTAGGVDLKEVDFKTMQSKLVPNLHFAGEVLNIDGITGGFNFQNAWTTGYLAGRTLASYSAHK